eukprot:TRINITY_DN3049_c0_g1_i10.p2 TRINITY_DN3049_c0_g1~~TRINITY_DN3049_c0_g1_i10.p2  ORF type:complete len:250 (-),score=37.26 TRINITY_DN3049_c0_g1_i10:1233-1895(-)
MTTESDGIIFTEIDWTSPDLWDDSDLIKAWNETDKSKRNRKKKNVRKEQPGNEAQRETQEIDTKTMEGKPNDHEQNQYDSRSQKYNEGYANHYSYPMYYPVQGDFSNQHTISDYPSAFHVGQQNPHECLHRFVPGSYPMYPFAPFTYPHYPPSRSPHPSHHPHVQSHESSGINAEYFFFFFFFFFFWTNSMYLFIPIRLMIPLLLRRCGHEEDEELLVQY